MRRAISRQEFVDTASGLIQTAGNQTVFIQKDSKTVAAIVSMTEYDSTRQARRLPGALIPLH